jgi:hypothetical protein
MEPLPLKDCCQQGFLIVNYTVIARRTQSMMAVSAEIFVPFEWHMHPLLWVERPTPSYHSVCSSKLLFKIAIERCN